MKKKTKFKKDIMAVLHSVLTNQIIIMNALSTIKELESYKKGFDTYCFDTSKTLEINIAPWLNWNGESND